MSEALPEIYLARHGESRANIEGVLSHRVGEHPLTERGRRQARALAEWLAIRHGDQRIGVSVL